MVNFLFSFLLSFLAAIAGLALRGAMPFGDGSLLAIDAWGQYYPMLCGGNKKRGIVLVIQRTAGF